jgi:hypothetical protein
VACACLRRSHDTLPHRSPPHHRMPVCVCVCVCVCVGTWCVWVRGACVRSVCACVRSVCACVVYVGTCACTKGSYVVRSKHTCVHSAENEKSASVLQEQQSDKTAKPQNSIQPLTRDRHTHTHTQHARIFMRLRFLPARRRCTGCVEKTGRCTESRARRGLCASVHRWQSTGTRLCRAHSGLVL